MRFKKTIALLLGAWMLCAPLAACQKSDSPSKSALTAPPNVDTSPVQIEEGTDYEALAAERLDAITATPETDFTYTVADGSVTVTAYTGSAASVRVPDTIQALPVRAIAAGAFADNKTLEALILPDGLTQLGTGILTGCTALKYLETPLLGADASAPQFLGYLYGAAEYAESYRVPNALALLRLSGNSKTLPAYALYGCDSLLCVMLPESLETIEACAMFDCRALEQLIGLESVVTVGEYAFADCSALQELTFGSNTTSIGFAALYGCERLVSLTLPFAGGSLTENNYLAYLFGAESPDFAKGYYPASLARVEFLPSCTALGNYAFYECETLKEVVLPDGLRTIGVRAFDSCTALWSITLPDSLTSIRENAFFGCQSLQTVKFGNGLKSIGVNAFYSCLSLREIDLPQSLKSLPASCFADCVSLQTVRLGGVTSVGAQAFRSCSAVKKVSASEKVKFEDGNSYVSDRLK
ncbi:MAG: leucine-rich repeat protein [Clostridia bacterium]|nr:leucine-rich repeat protein [Clostridia bacterium]MBQ9774221.1 leucine-rich repeat protein [Clostridia bacterium]